MQAMGSFGLQMDYTVRMKLRLTDEVDGAILAEAVAKTQRRFPYLSLRMCRNEQEFYYEQNSAPVVLFHTDKAIQLNSEEANYHVWAVCYWEDYLYLDIYHGLCDGTACIWCSRLCCTITAMNDMASRRVRESVS